ncbi:unnamed protein product [Phytophthora lilii]|uniref:Unnamed protein product n=1 Tax=Phytophthora lilii TaxID=2077276 RepID=A0A9W6UB13_9STRA|nr:unnamed protein product [Phytophthora lilii]
MSWKQYLEFRFIVSKTVISIYLMSEIVSVITINRLDMTQLSKFVQKRQELLERAQRRVRQAKSKREMYEGASWASDITNGITTVPKKSTESTQTDSSQSAESLRKL